MSASRRIATIYSKELIDILRDRRTLIAMILVPIVLYPLLMLGSIQAVSFQATSLEHERLVIGVADEAQGHLLNDLIERDKRALARQREKTKNDEVANVEKPADWPTVKVLAVGGRERIEKLVKGRAIHVGVIFDGDVLYNEPAIQNRIELYYDKEDIRSLNAAERLKALIERTGKRTVEARKRQAGLPATFDDPFQVKSIDLSSPPSILGQVLPLILILMTITGAIYPAIDLTAGERERGTLESLMVSPVPVLDLIVGKFLVVATVAIMGAALNLASVTATVYFGGFDRVIATTGGSLPIMTMVVILLCLVPFAVLMSAIMIAVCSFARTFKEAQNYVTPVILAVLIPGGIAALPATRLDGIMLVMPVGNMVLLARDLLVGATVPGWHVATVLLSTTLYSVAAVAVAANLFGKESVVFSDSGSLRRLFMRSLFQPSDAPSPSLGLLVVALLFPVWFFVQAAFGPAPGEDASGLLYISGAAMPLLFVALPVSLMVYARIDVGRSLRLHRPSVRHLLAAAVVGTTAWIPAHAINVLQQQILGVPEAVVQSAEQMVKALQALPLLSVFVLIAVIPALCEELLFRGFLLSSLGSKGRKWTAILISAAVFGVFHFFLFKFVVTAGLGVLLAYLCWQSRSIVPAVLAHLLHNGIGAIQAVRPAWLAHRGLGLPEGWHYLPPTVMVVGSGVFLIGLCLIIYPVRPPVASGAPAVTEGV